MPHPRRSQVANEILNLRRSLRALDKSLRRLGPMLSSGEGDGRVQKRAPVRRTLHLSPQRRAALKLHGRYIGYIRQLKPRQKAQVRKTREAKGVRVAIARARRLAQV